MKRRTSGWSYRLVKEGERSKSALFVTLTYDTSCVPISENGFMNLDKTDVQKFFKRLRKLSNEKLKYYVCGEYGTKKMRPHYHIILFNANKEMVHKAWMLNNKPLGSIFIGQVTDASIGYTLKYMTKKGKIPLHFNDDRQKEFSLMSKKMGDNYITKNMVKWHKEDLEKRMYVNIPGNKKIAMPRYYKDKIYNEIEKQKISEYLLKISEQETEKLQKELGDNYEKTIVQQHIKQFSQMYKNAEQGRYYE